MRWTRLLTVAIALGLLALVPAAPAGAKAKPRIPRIQVLSNRADLVSGGDALVRVTVPKRTRHSRVSLYLGRRKVTKKLRWINRRMLEGRLAGFRVGRNALTARIRRDGAARLYVTDHHLGGPVFAGPQIQPWTCGNAGAKDKQCNAKTKTELKYLPKGAPQSGGGVPGTSSDGVSPFQPYDPHNPPSRDQIATATTTDGKTVPFIVRVQTGYLDRDQFKVASLFDPKKRWTATRPQKQWNRRLVLTHGFSCDTAYTTGDSPSVLVPKVLGGGFVVASHALDHAGHDCNLLTQAESLVMTKEWVQDHLGTVRWTIGSGCSGGSLTQQQVANAYPGVYQGITPQCSFTDAWSSAMQYEEYYFGLKYFGDPSRWSLGTIWDPDAERAVFDHPNLANPVTFTQTIPNSGEPTRSCPGVDRSKVYDEKTNPKGVRCTLQDYMVNAFGHDRRGFARRGYDNVGIQYGLQGLRAHRVSAQQFADLNQHIGGADIDLNITPTRTAADPLALKRLYRTGAIDSANHLNRVAIIDLRGPDPGAFHDVFRTYAMRARLMRNFGTAANQVLWRGQAPLIGDPSYADDSVFAMDRWLARVHADRRKVSLPKKIIQDKPDSVGPRCTNGAGTEVAPEVCDTTVQAYGTPRLGADEPMTDDVMKCRLKPLRRDDYPVAFTDAQWAALKQAFPTGVCDYGKPGVSQRGAIGWLTYQDRRGRAIYGGRPMGRAPRSHRVK